MLGLFPVLALGLVVYFATVTLFTYFRLTRPPRRTYAWAVAKGLPGEPGELEKPRRFERFEYSRDGATFVGWSIEGDAPDGPVVVLTHGWADSKVGGLGRVEAAAPLASRVVAWDMRGHGESDGTSTLGLREKDDLLALIEMLEEITPIVLFGWSLGAGVSIAAAAECTRVVGVIAESPYRFAATPAGNVLAMRAMPWRVNLPLALRLVGSGAEWQAFDRGAIAARLRVPLLVIHGEADVVSPIEDGRAIAAAGGGEFVPLAAGHNDVWTGESRQRAVDAVGAFVQRVCGAGSGGSPANARAVR